MPFKIITDSACDLPMNMLQQLDVSTAKLHVLFKGENLPDSVDQVKEIYAGLRAGEKTQTSAVNLQGWAESIEPALESGFDALVLCFSSGLSTTYQSAVIAAAELEEKYPQRKIRVIDTRCAALGQGLLVWHTCKKRDQGLSLDDLASWVEENKQHICHWFTVDDLMFLKRGGRISGATAVMGTMLRIKPVLRVDENGKLENVAKCRGRKAAMETLASKLAAAGENWDNSTVFICHGDCPEEGETLKELVLKICGPREIFMGNLGAVIGSHAGPGTLALFFMGDKR